MGRNQISFNKNLPKGAKSRFPQTAFFKAVGFSPSRTVKIREVKSEGEG